MLRDLQELGINLSCLESRPSHKNPGQEYEFYVEMCIDDKCDIDVASSLKEIAVDVRMLSEPGALCVYDIFQVSHIHVVQVSCLESLVHFQ